MIESFVYGFTGFFDAEFFELLGSACALGLFLLGIIAALGGLAMLMGWAAERFNWIE